MIAWGISAGTVLLVDQLSKSLVRKRAGRRGASRNRFLRIRLVENRNPLGRRSNPGFLLLIWVAALLSAMALYSSGGWFHGTLAVCGLGLAFGGATGNLVDLLRFRFVVDFIDLRWWPVFNFADSAIVAGLVLAFWPKG